MNLKILHWNCRYIKNKLDLLKCFVEKEKPDVVLLNEIGLKPTEANFYLNFTGYNYTHRCRSDKKGGGVAI